jgi:error-prone DNA polymerase
LARRVAPLRKQELVMLAQIDALWQAEYARKPSGSLFKDIPEEQEQWKATSLFQITTEERLVADYRGTGMTVGRHPMSHHREMLAGMGVSTASDLGLLPQGQRARIAGCVISRQRPGTAKGFGFLSIEDETGVSRAIIHPDLFEKERALVSYGKFLQIEGPLQNENGLVSIRASEVLPLTISAADVPSHDFH